MNSKNESAPVLAETPSTPKENKTILPIDPTARAGLYPEPAKPSGEAIGWALTARLRHAGCPDEQISRMTREEALEFLQPWRRYCKEGAQLSLAHLKLIVDSGIAPEVAQERGYRTITNKAELERYGFGYRQRITPTLLIPTYSAEGKHASWQHRPDTPRTAKNGKPVKYETPANSSMVIDVHPSLARKRTIENGGPYFDTTELTPLIADPTVPLFITEGVRKEDTAVSVGLCCIALLGVWNWRGKNKAGGKVALPDWEFIALDGRTVYIAFDSDVMTKPEVAKALARLKAFLDSRKAIVKIIYLPCGPHGEKVGLDDFIAARKGADNQTIITELLRLATDKLPESTVGKRISATIQGSPDEPQPPDEFSDIALSNGFVSGMTLIGGEKEFKVPGLGVNFRYVKEFDRWYEYHQSEGRWAEDRKLRVCAMVKRFLTELACAMVDAAAEEHKDNPDKRKQEEAIEAATDQGRILTSARKVHDVLTLTRSHVQVAILQQQFDADIHSINTPGGTVDLRTGEIRPARREDYFTKTTPAAPHDEPTPIFDVFMRDIMGACVKPNNCKCAACAQSKGKPDEERFTRHLQEVDRLVQYQLRVYGHALTGDVSEQKLLMQEGEGGNGKGTLNDFMSNHIFGRQPNGYAAEIPIEALLESRNEQHPTALMQLWHARLALARESDERSRWNEGRVKRLTGGDLITARYMRQDFITFDATHTLIVFVNVRPALSGGDQAAWKRRLQVTPFPQLWADKANEDKGILQRDSRMGEKLAAEASGVLFKLIRACVDWYRDRDLKAPETVLQTSSEYLAQQSTGSAFIDDCFDRSNPNQNTTANEAWPAYIRWCERMREHPCKRTHFNAMLERAGIKIERTNSNRGVLLGVTLKVAEPEQDASESPNKQFVTGSDGTTYYRAFAREEKNGGSIQNKNISDTVDKGDPRHNPSPAASPPASDASGPAPRPTKSIANSRIFDDTGAGPTKSESAGQRVGGLDLDATRDAEIDRRAAADAGDDGPADKTSNTEEDF